MNTNNKPRLRIVWDKDAAPKSEFVYKEPVQLSFLLEREDNCVVFVEENALTGRLLIELLRTLQPRYLLDLRTCPRFDLFDYSRKRAFSDFSLYGTRYFCLSSDEASLEMSKRVQTVISKLEKDLFGPLVVIVEQEETVEQISRELPKPQTIGKTVAGNKNWKFTIAGLQQNSVAVLP